MAFEIGIRNAEIIERWGIVPRRNGGSMGAHSHRVAIYVQQICVILGITDINFILEAVNQALWHDMPEVITGDIMGPTKPHIDRAKLSEYEYQVLTKYFPSLAWGSPLEGLAADSVDAIIKVADMLDEVLWIIGEEKMGNQHLSNAWFGSHEALYAALTNLAKVGVRDEDATRLTKTIGEAIQKHRGEPWALVRR